MQKRHHDRKQYFDELAISSANYFIPYIEQLTEITPKTTIFEIGCGDGGNLLPFARLGCKVTGVDLTAEKIEQAKLFFAEDNLPAKLNVGDIFEVTATEQYDIVMVHDVVEHIFQKKEFMEHVKKFVAPGGMVFFGFPAWQMPFGGHQQICKSRLVSNVPFIHLLPKPLYRAVLKRLCDARAVQELMEIRSTRITIEDFQRLVQTSGYKIVNRKLWFINPHYEVKFGLKPRVLSPAIAAIPYIRNFFSTSCFFVLKLN